MKRKSALQKQYEKARNKRFIANYKFVSLRRKTDKAQDVFVSKQVDVDVFKIILKQNLN